MNVAYLAYYFDYCVLYKNEVDLQEIIDAFHVSSLGLVFTTEKADINEQLQFLELKISVGNGLCYSYDQRSIKPLLPFNSHHSMKIKNSVAIGPFINAMKKSCPCKVKDSILKQERRLRSSGYPDQMIQESKRKLLHSKNETFRGEVKCNIGVPQVHGITHRLGKAAMVNGVRVVGTYKQKLSTLPAIIDRMRLCSNRIDLTCSEKHNSKVFECKKDNVYEINLSCGMSYIGETSKCPNSRLDEHLSMKAKYATFTEHKLECGCKVNEAQSRLFLAQGIKDSYPRKIYETICIENAQKVGKVISNPSIIPTTEERKWFEKFPPKIKG